jgi:hypothetical protein
VDLPTTPLEMRYSGTDYAPWEAEQVARDYIKILNEFISEILENPTASQQLEDRDKTHIIKFCELLNDVLDPEYGYLFGIVEDSESLNPEFLY